MVWSVEDPLAPPLGLARTRYIPFSSQLRILALPLQAHYSLYMSWLWGIWSRRASSVKFGTTRIHVERRPDGNIAMEFSIPYKHLPGLRYKALYFPEPHELLEFAALLERIADASVERRIYGTAKFTLLSDSE